MCNPFCQTRSTQWRSINLVRKTDKISRFSGHFPRNRATVPRSLQLARIMLLGGASGKQAAKLAVEAWHEKDRSDHQTVQAR
jgi:hypothetical protein